MYGKGTERENAPFFEALSGEVPVSILLTGIRFANSNVYLYSTDESGWAWFIPLHNGLTSVGVVMDQKSLGIRSRAVSSATAAPLPPSPLSMSFGASPLLSDGSSASTSSTTAMHMPASPTPANARRHATLADKYLTFLHLAPGVQALLGEDATLERVCDENGDAPAARSASDFSYSSDCYSGTGWRVVGDAGGVYFLFLLP